MTPFEALYGIPPPQLALGPYLQTRVAAVGDYVKERQQIDNMLKQNLRVAKERMKKYVDERRSEREFREGDWVYLRLQPYRIEKRIGNVAYRLQLPITSKVHPVFHVSLLKKKVGDKATPTLQLPEIDEKGH
ncbi:uncharacterized protein [Coffea arabica]|uniref:Tf2-1-like SH3-like domain-containing protein n=1 Tax=Coffea arabica TaxID=13443 RepID=A0A6P6V9D4_COFAR|nr:uncharacterized protein LOC113718633 [Coffea arabica]